MKRTVDLPESLVRRAEATASADGVSVEQLIAAAVEERIGSSTDPAAPERDTENQERPWMAVINALPRVPKETLDAVEAAVAQADREDLAAQTSRRT